LNFHPFSIQWDKIEKKRKQSKTIDENTENNFSPSQKEKSANLNLHSLKQNKKHDRTKTSAFPADSSDRLNHQGNHSRSFPGQALSHTKTT
jgi:hypothetical protein